MERRQLAASIAMGWKISRGIIGIYLIGENHFEARLRNHGKARSKRSHDLAYIVRWRNAMARKYHPGEPHQINDMKTVFEHFGIPLEKMK